MTQETNRGSARSRDSGLKFIMLNQESKSALREEIYCTFVGSVPSACLSAMHRS